MATKLRVFTNADDALIFWSIPAPIAGCRGFAIERKRRTADGRVEQGFLDNRVGFASDDATKMPATPEDAKPFVKPSTEAPFQRFSWTDYDLDAGDTVSYRVTPVTRNGAGPLVLDHAQQSDWSASKTLSAGSDNGFQAFFNRGFVMSQFMARYLHEQKKTLAQFKKTISDEDDKTIRGFLSGGLRLALLGQLQQAKAEGGEIRAVLFELDDAELIDALCALGPHAQVVLANGSVEAAKGETAAQARATEDENRSARKKLGDAGVQVTDRRTAPGPLAHNKFFVRLDKHERPAAVWTGSTNWTSTGLCTQINNGLLTRDPAAAQIFLDQFNLLKQCKSSFPDTLVDANDQPKSFGVDQPGQVRSTVWFSRTRKLVDLTALEDQVAGAKAGILFLMFMPGAQGVFGKVAARAAEPGLYVRGVVSDLPRGQGDESAADINLVSGATHDAFHLDIVQPEGIPHAFASFAAEVTRKQFLGSIGYAIVHSKVLVIDPFSSDPTVITGSHNFSPSASSKNDENFVIVRGDRALAEAHAVNIMGVYAHYRWRAYLAENPHPFAGLQDNDTWQAPSLRSHQGELRFWGV